MSQAVEFSSSIDEQLCRWLGAIPILLPILQSLNVVSIINRYCPCHADVDEGIVALVLALNGVLRTVGISRKKVEGAVEAQALILYSVNKAKLDEGKRDTLLNRFLARLGTIGKHLNSRKYKKKAYTLGPLGQIDKAWSKYSSVRSLVDIQLTGEDGQLALSLSFSINDEQVAKAKERDGRYMLGTNRALSEEEMLTHYKRQDRIEKRIRTTKGPIRVRPMFLHNQERSDSSQSATRHIESLVFICMLALLVFSILEMLAKQAGIPMTGESILKQFQTSAVIRTIFRDGNCWKQLAPLTRFQTEFIQALGLPDPEIYLSRVKLE